MSNLASNTPSLQSILDTVNALPDKVDTSGTATAADIYTGKTATVNDVKLTGTNPWNDGNVTPYVTEALAALAEHGVDSTGKGLADLAALIAGIESGGGLLHTSTFCMSEDTLIHGDFYHNAGFAPDFVIVIPAYSTITTYAEGRTQCAVFISNPNLGLNDEQINLYYVVSWLSSSEKRITVKTSLNINAFLPTNEKICFYLNSNVHKFLAGDVYTFIAAKVWG